jgi:CRP-like cAMP-binding protein
MRISDVVTVLRRTPIFRDVDDRALNVIAFNGERVPFAAGDELVTRGDQARSALIILTGKAEVDPGDRSRPMPCGPATIIGELALLVGRDAAATVRAVTDGEGLRIDRPLFERVVAEFPEVAAQLRDGMLHRMRGMLNDLSGLEAVLRFEPVSATSRQVPRPRGHDRTAAPSPGSRRQR